MVKDDKKKGNEGHLYNWAESWIRNSKNCGGCHHAVSTVGRNRTLYALKGTWGERKIKTLREKKMWFLIDLAPKHKPSLAGTGRSTKREPLLAHFSY